jgi:triacylglycerol lipase
MARMARWLARVGYRAHLSGIDWNVGCPGRKVELLSWRIQKIARESGAPLVLVGHSLGGLLARSVAVLFPEQVRHLVMLGAPRPTESWAAIRPEWRPAARGVQSLWSAIGATAMRCGTTQCGCTFARSSASLPSSVGLSSIYTRSDEVIDWRTCIDSRARNHEVPGGHLSLHVNRHVYRLLAEILADDHPTRSRLEVFHADASGHEPPISSERSPG